MLRYIIRKLEHLERWLSYLSMIWDDWKSNNLPWQLRTSLNNTKERNEKQRKDISEVTKLLRQKKPNVAAALVILDKYDIHITFKNLYRELYSDRIETLIPKSKK